MIHGTGSRVPGAKAERFRSDQVFVTVPRTITDVEEAMKHLSDVRCAAQRVKCAVNDDCSATAAMTFKWTDYVWISSK